MRTVNRAEGREDEEADEGKDEERLMEADDADDNTRMASSAQAESSRSAQTTTNGSSPRDGQQSGRALDDTWDDNNDDNKPSFEDLSMGAALGIEPSQCGHHH